MNTPRFDARTSNSQRASARTRRATRAASGAALALALATSACTGAAPVPNCDNPFDTAVAAGRKLNAVLGATNDLLTSIDEFDSRLLTICRGMATDLAIPESELAPASSSETPTQAACARVVRQIRENLAAVRGGAGVTLIPDLAPPVCRVDIDAYARCTGSCDATFTPGMSTLMCTGGEIRGQCSAMCTGTCAVDVSGSCSASCEGTCSGSCTGTCVGQCEGECSSRGPDGQCNGSCTGTCRGTCQAGCTGSCMGRCVATASATCSGECRGSCSVAFVEPRCTGTVTPPMVDVDCKAACDARFNARPTCEPGRARLVVVGSVSTEAQAAFARTNAAIVNHYGEVLAIGEQLRRMAQSGQALVTTLRGLGSQLGGLTASAVVCTADAAVRATTAVSKVQVTVTVSVSVAGSIAP